MMSHIKDGKSQMEQIDLFPGRSSFVFEDTKCPCCGHVMNAVTGAEGESESPNPGDVSVCIECTSYLIFDHDLKLQVMTVDEVCELDSEVLYTLTATRNHINKLKRIFKEEGREW